MTDVRLTDFLITGLRYPTDAEIDDIDLWGMTTLERESCLLWEDIEHDLMLAEIDLWTASLGG